MGYTAIQHVTGPYDISTNLQKCTMCGKILLDNQSGMIPQGATATGGYDEGVELYEYANKKSIAIATDEHIKSGSMPCHLI
jgi:hypothetical protein